MYLGKQHVAYEALFTKSIYGWGGEGGEVVSKVVLICKNILESQENRKLQ